jgi:hypothetical protein
LNIICSIDKKFTAFFSFSPMLKQRNNKITLIRYEQADQAMKHGSMVQSNMTNVKELSKELIARSNKSLEGLR